MNAPDHPPGRGAPRAVAWAGLALAAAVLFAHARHFDFVTDDAFISFRYADNLVRHGELTFNPGERVEGYTGLLWTAILAAVLRAGGDPVAWSQGLGIAFSEATLALVFLVSLRGRPRAESPAWAALAPLLLALASPFAAWSEGGLETALFTFLLTAAALRHLVELEGDRLPWSAALAALATVARPEGLLLFAVLVAHRVLFDPAPPRARVRPLLERAAFFAVVFVPYWTWRWRYYGHPLPNTFYAKAGPALWGPGWRYVGTFAWETQAWVVVPLLALAWGYRPRGAPLASLTVLLAAPWTVYVAFVGGDFMGLYRFLVPLLPLLALGAQEGLCAAVALGRAGGGARRGAWAAAVVVLVLAHAALNLRLTSRALEVGSRDGVDSVGWLKAFVAQTTAIARHLASAYPPGTTIATSAAGVIPYYSRMPTLDLLGINDVHVAHDVPAAADRAGHRKAAPEAYVLARRPRLLIGHPWITDAPPVVPEGDRRYWRDRGYAFRTVEVPGLRPPFWSYLEAEPRTAAAR